MASIGSVGLWIWFTVFILILLALDLGFFHREAKEVRVREALLWSLIWISLALLFNAFIYFWFGPRPALEFLTGYIIEKSLSVDNLFVFIVLFSYFCVPKNLHHRVLFWGILAALVMRAGFIAMGAALVHSFGWMLYLFGAFLVFTGIKLFFQDEIEVHPERNWIVKLYQRFVPAVSSYHEHHFMILKDGKWFATPLLLVLVVINITDIIFAVDSIPAIFAITTDPFNVYTSNIFAILGLRALYFLLAGMIGKFHYLKIGLAIVLIFIGTKMLIVKWFPIPIVYSLLFVVSVIALSILVSLLKPKKELNL